MVATDTDRWRMLIATENGNAVVYWNCFFFTVFIPVLLLYCLFFSVLLSVLILEFVYVTGY